SSSTIHGAATTSSSSLSRRQFRVVLHPTWPALLPDKTSEFWFFIPYFFTDGVTAVYLKEKC
ncbi:hypothetical protein TSAR_014422, partial [Trichomalopsis sarcophagae]